MKKKVRVGILANELFSKDVGRMGGFGWAMRQVSECFSNAQDLGFEAVLLMGERARSAEFPRTLHNSPVFWRAHSNWTWLRQLRAARIDVLLSIDYRPNYRYFYGLLPTTPVILWVRDPWDDKDREVIKTLRVPGQEGVPPQGVRPPNTRSLRRMLTLSRVTGRPFLFAVTTPALATKVSNTYGVSDVNVSVLPNIMVPHAGSVRKASRPVVAYLARLDPVKRPWLLTSLAERMPDVEFVVMGQNHFTGPGSWQPTSIPPNMRMVGHADEAAKRAELESAWVLVNTSIHEGLSVSFLESLAFETPVVSSVNPENVVSRFGEWVGREPGTGEGSLDGFQSALRGLITDESRRRRLGAEGRAWVEKTHCRSEFLRSFNRLCADAGVLGEEGK